MRVNDQEDKCIPEASCLPYLRPGVMTWPITSGTCWRSPAAPPTREAARAVCRVEQAAADQRDPLADPGRLAVAGRPA